MKNPEKILSRGNEALAQAAIDAGCRFYAAYPITPQNEIPEYMARCMPRAGGVFLQAESELAAINMVYGAAATGVRAMTTSSSPGISLMQEAISYMAGAELPAVIANVQRGGPGLGNISGSQADYFQAVKGGGHGDYRLLVYAPYSVQEIRDLTMRAFDKADEYRNPVMILADGILGQMMEPVSMTPYARPDLPPKKWALTGCEGRQPNVIKSLYMGDGELEMRNALLQEKYRRMAANEAMSDSYLTEDAGIVIVAFGIAARIARSAVDALRAEGLKAGLFRPVTLFPFPGKELSALSGEAGKKFLVFELNAGQMVEDVRLSVGGKAPVLFHGRPGGAIVSPEELTEKIKELFS
ncbi:MAG: 3-methyl-2-oxobutanoate dehydrogenase subunit VorB [Nitrospiraceae bacterium]|nr:3-methyl-2-oxobutanoate dehydrogenase subunit VorB [Nitrospiraceae bacterium]